MAKNQFEAGDEVQHRTGGPKMIYIGESQTGDALCEWVDPSGNPQRGSFAPVALKLYEKQKASIRMR